MAQCPHCWEEKQLFSEVCPHCVRSVSIARQAVFYLMKWTINLLVWIGFAVVILVLGSWLWG
jgi:hypothetical protein